jgi:hypothetical protein
MPYKVHLENREPPQDFVFAGKLFKTHVVPETEPLFVVETKEEAKEAMQRLIEQGVRPGSIYSVGYDSEPWAR